MQTTNTTIGMFDTNTQLALQFLEKQKRAELITETTKRCDTNAETEEMDAEIYRFTTKLALQFIEKVKYGANGGF